MASSGLCPLPADHCNPPFGQVKSNQPPQHVCSITCRQHALLPCINQKKRNSMIHYPAYKVAVAHVAPVFLDTERSVAKACAVIEEAAGRGARLIAFPEVFLPGFPVWAGVAAPIRTHELFKRLAAAAIRIDGPELARVRQTARTKE